MEYSDFVKSIKKVTGNRAHKITNSYGVYDAFKYYRKNKPKDKKFILTESQYFAIIRGINDKLVDALSNGSDINLPERMGRIELRKYSIEPRINSDGKLVYKAPVNWDATLKLWYEDEEARDNKTIIKVESDTQYKVLYNKSRAIYNNKVFYTLSVNRELRKKIYTAAKNGTLDAFTFKK